MSVNKNIICIFAHPDDEIAFAGTILKNKSDGHNVFLVCLTGNPKRKVEFEKSCKLLNVDHDYFGLCEDDFDLNPLKVKPKLMKLLKDFKPDIVITHNSNDYHPHHQTTFKLVRGCVEFSMHHNDFLIDKFLMSEDNTLFESPDIIFNITDYMDKKIECLGCYISELKKDYKKNYYYDFIKSKARLRGVQGGVKYAEAFKEIILPIHGNFYSKSRYINQF